MQSAHARVLCHSVVQSASQINVGGGVRASHIGGESELLGWWCGLEKVARGGWGERW